MSEQIQDLQDYIQYQFDDISSFKLAVFLNKGKVRVTVAMGEVEKGFTESLVSATQDSPDNFQLTSNEFSKSSKSFEKLLEYTTSTSSPRVYITKRNDNILILYCCGTTIDKDADRVKELMTDLLY